MNKLKTVLGIGALALVSLSSCQKVKKANLDASQTNARMENIFDDIYSQIDEAADTQEELNKVENGNWTLHTSACGDVTLTPLGADYPKTLTLDFGTECVGTDGRTRSGQIVCTFSGPWNEAGTVVNATLVDYHVDEYSVQGSKTVTNQGTNGLGQPYYSVVVSGVVVSWDNNQVSWESARTRTWTEGYDTHFWTWDSTNNTFLFFNGIIDDRYEITGTAAGTGVNGNSYDITVTSPLKWGWDCWYIKEGTITIEPENYDSGIVDFGDGQCDNDATLEVNGNVYNFQM